MTTTGYIRVSTNDQDLEKNRHEILELANERGLGRVTWVEEKASGAIHWRKRRIGEVVEAASAGDVIIVPELSRLGRSMLEIMEILSIASDKNVQVYAIKGDWHLDDSMQSRIVAMVLAMAAEIERDLIRSRTRESLKARKLAGKTLGRPPGTGKSKLDPYEPEIRALLAQRSTKKFIAERYGVKPNALTRWLKKHKIE